MRVLVACEMSGVVREAFANRGHDAWSCDILPSLLPGNHVQGDVMRLLDDDWDMLIAFPPCTHLAVSGARWFKDKAVEQQIAIKFFLDLTNAPIPRICIENPVGIMSTHYRKPNQYIQPWQFGHDASKKTGLWLKGLAPLKATGNVPARILGGKKRWGNQTDSGQNKLTPSDDRAMLRSLTYQGIAHAMADQWG